MEGVQPETVPQPDHAALIAQAGRLVRPLKLSKPDLDAATVGCALVAEGGRIYEGVCVHLTCGLGFCAEAAAIANMLQGGETRIRTIVAVSRRGVLSPCGRCREMIAQVNLDNMHTDVLMPGGRVVKLRELLPEHWM